MPNWGDVFSMGTLTGGLSSPINPLGGAFSGYQQQKAARGQKDTLGQARLKLEELARRQRGQRMADLQKTMSFFDPVDEQYRRLYGGGAPGGGGGMPGGGGGGGMF